MSISVENSLGADLSSLYKNLFKKIDANGDGSISKTEFESAVSSMAKNKNISTDEADAMFSKLDTDGNGTVSESEMMQALKTAGQQMQANMPPPPPPPEGGPQGDDSQSLTDDQKKTVDSILSQYDSSNLTADDVKAINTAISDARISFGKSLGDEIESQGFDIQTMMSLSPPDAPGRAQSAGSSSAQARGNMSGENALFSDLIKSLSSSDDSENSILSALMQSLKSSSGDNEDQISSMFNSLLSQLQNSAQYGQSGTLSYNVSTTQSLLSEYA